MLLSLTACSNLSKPTNTEYVYVKTTPPIEWLEDCPIAQPFQGMTNSDLAILAKERGLSLMNCNADKQALRDWVKSTNEPAN